MAIEFVGGNTATKVGGSSASTIALNSGLTGGIASSVSEGDLVIAVFAAGSTTDLTLSITDGSTEYTLIDSEHYVDDTRDTNLRVAYKFMGATPDTSTTFGAISSADDSGAMAVYVFRGVDQTTPLDGVTPTSSTAQNTVLVNPPSITPSSTGAFIVVAGAGGHSAGSRTFGSTDLTDFLTAGSNDVYDATVGVGHKPDWTSGAFDPAAWTFSLADSTAYSNAVICFVLRPAASGSKTLTADAGSYSVTGGAASLEIGREVLALSGSYTVSGTDASLERGYEVLAEAGAYTINGSDAFLELGREVLAEGGAYLVSGTDATLTKAADKTLSAEAGSYSVTGVDSSLELGREVLALGGSYSITGGAAGLEYGREVLALAGSYTVTGGTASLELGRELLAESAAYLISGTDATLAKSGAKSLAADGGAYLVSGTDATLQYTQVAPRGLILPPVFGGWKKKKKKPEKEELVEEVAAAVIEAVPEITVNESHIVAERLVAQMTWTQLRKIETLDALVVRVERELAEMEDEEILLLAA